MLIEIKKITWLEKKCLIGDLKKTWLKKDCVIEDFKT